MAPVEMTLMLGALLFCSGEALERHGELQRSPPTMAAWDMARAAIVPGPAAPPPDATRPRTRSCPKPDYPPLARREGAEGATRLAFLITERGAYSKVHIVRSSGDTPAHKLLDFTAVAALADCRWEPSKRNGEAQKAWAFIEFVWTLR